MGYFHSSPTTTVPFLALWVEREANNQLALPRFPPEWKGFYYYKVCLTLFQPPPQSSRACYSCTPPNHLGGNPGRSSENSAIYGKSQRTHPGTQWTPPISVGLVSRGGGASSGISIQDFSLHPPQRPNDRTSWNWATWVLLLLKESSHLGNRCWRSTLRLNRWFKLLFLPTVKGPRLRCSS